MLYRNISIVIVLFSRTSSSAYSDHYTVYRASDLYTVYRVSDHYTVYRANVGQTEEFPHFHHFCVSYIQPINSSFIHVRVARYAYSTIAVLM